MTAENKSQRKLCGKLTTARRLSYLGWRAPRELPESGRQGHKTATTGKAVTAKETQPLLKMVSGAVRILNSAVFPTIRFPLLPYSGHETVYKPLCPCLLK